MANSGQIGPDATVRVDGKSEHDLGTFNWTKSKPKEPFTQIGKDVADRYTSGAKTISWDGEAQSGPDGKFAIPWDSLCDTNKTIPLVFSCNGRTERLLGACVDEVGNSYQRSDGKWVKKVSGKAFDHKYG